MREGGSDLVVGAPISHPQEKEARSFLVLTVRVNSERGTRRLRGLFSQLARTRGALELRRRAVVPVFLSHQFIRRCAAGEG